MTPEDAQAGMDAWKKWMKDNVASLADGDTLFTLSAAILGAFLFRTTAVAESTAPAMH